jgi:hypothetical protein
MPLVDDVSGDEQSRYMGYVIGTITPVLGDSDSISYNYYDFTTLCG